ncbi:NADPH:quinone reductase-like Zn-dependent oxidoreductase [Streptomyces aurantiacus]|uniref:NADP-dependent oxidoreductase n=1 Tax=Streptomyces aurantiacus TaxID=47760 RepID=UPI0027934F58|nr:NADP-dependent oxidoreductase [Streptomyces aurantiacus]MDQ0774221.1 NADPH:quinone reductase-like Zn-dependent oxidoreductase [Streptomyces aurantiacus]
MLAAKRIQYHRYGGPEVLRLEDFVPPQPGRGEVLVRVKAAAANAMDWKIRNGELRLMTGRGFPRGMGNDFAGVVEAVGAGVTRLRAGDAVLGGTSLKGAGTFAEMVIATEEAVVSKPAELSYEQAAAIPVVGVTAFQAMRDKGKLRPGQAVFINGCLGGVGRTAAQIALTFGASVAGSCRATDVEEARELGIAPIVEFDFDAARLEGRFDLLLDTAGTLSATAAQTMVKRGGRILDIVPTPSKFARSALPGPYRVMMGRPNPEDLAEVAEMAARGRLRIPIARTVPLADAIPVLTELERHRTPRGGKLIVTAG